MTRGVVLFQFFDVRFSGAPVNGVLQHQSGLAALRQQVLAKPELEARIRHKFKIKNTTGYSLNALVDFEDPFDILKHLLVGSEGTLGVITSVTLKVFPTTVTTRFAAYRLATVEDGIEILIHVGMDTVEMQGKGFKALVKVGDKVKAGTPLLKVDLDAIRAAGHPTATAIIVTNGDDMGELKMLAEGDVLAGTPLFKF